MTTRQQHEPDFTITQAVIPMAVGAEGWQDFVEMTAIRNAVEAEGYGTEEFARPAEELLPSWHKQEHEPKRLYLARRGGRIVARGYLEWRNGADAADVAWVAINVARDARGHGIGSAIAELLEREATALGKSRLIAYVASRPAGGPQLASPTGFGGIARGNDETRFLLAKGFNLEQVERASRLALPVDDDTLAGLRAKAEERSGSGYRVHLWTDATPPQWREDIASLMTRMSTDAPSAGLGEPEDVWTVDRLLADEEAAALNDRVSLTAAAEHVPSGKLVAFSELDAPPARDRMVDQEDTLVLREHRGHRLGMLLKIANIQHLQQSRPGHPSIITFNAEENRPMLDVNEAVGFVPIGYDGAWKKVIAGPPA